jgi:hypothetical protein
MAFQRRKKTRTAMRSNGPQEQVRKSGPTGEWRNDPAKVARAVNASSIVAIMDVNGPDRYRVYYQDPELHLKECYYNTSASRWVAGEQSSRVMSID